MKIIHCYSKLFTGVLSEEEASAAAPGRGAAAAVSAPRRAPRGPARGYAGIDLWLTTHNDELINSLMNFSIKFRK